MPVFPYKLRPVPPQVAVLLEDGEHALCEDGTTLPLPELPGGYRVWGDWDLVSRLWGDGQGEALCWRLRPVRWRLQRQPGEDSWVSRHTDVRVLRTGWPETPEAAVAGLAAWRGWLASHGASPQGSMGSTSWSLLRSKLRGPLWMSVGELPPIQWIMGGRQELHAEMGRYEPARHYDLPGAYSTELGAMRYGGRWREVGKTYPYGLVARRGILCFVRARVRIPSDLPVGPLPKRPRRAPRGTDALLSFSSERYPTGKQVQGVWTWEELDAAEAAGCKISVLQVWVHLNADGKYPFRPWYEAVLEGRAMGGFASQLAKQTGNALWGQFCLAPGAERTVEHWNGSRERPRRSRKSVPLPGASPNYAPDLAETLTGRVRAELYRCMLQAASPPPRLLCAHTDGIWTEGGEWLGVPEGWRAKESASRLDLLTPQFIRFWRTPTAAPEYVVAGAPDTLAPALFERVWSTLASDGRVPA